MSENAVKSITLEYEDGTIKRIKKGLCMTMVENESGESVGFIYDMLGDSEQDFYTFIRAAISLGARMGMFGEETDE